MGRKLNIGAGATVVPGFEPWDLKGGKPGYPLDVADESIEEIYASHVLEHWSHRETLPVLRDWFRALQPGGRCRVSVPDFDRVIKSYLTSEQGVPVELYILGGHVDENDQHRAVFNEAKLRQLMELAGFVDVKPWAAEYRDCASLPVSLRLQGTKPATAVTAPRDDLAPPKVDDVGREQAAALPPAGLRLPKIVAVWSCPRLGFLDAFNSVYVALPVFGIKLLRGMGVYWGQQIEALIDATSADAPEAVLTLDYDAVFQPDDLAELIRLFVTHPEADAICAHQWNRAVDKPLWTVDGRSVIGGNPVTAEELAGAGDLFPVSTSHFGLTLIRTSALRKMPKPWFHSVPAPDGTWGPGKVDADIRFWREFARSGARSFLAPRVVIGHLELAVRWPGRDLRLLWQHMYEYHDGGRPAAAFPSFRGYRQPVPQSVPAPAPGSSPDTGRPSRLDTPPPHTGGRRDPSPGGPAA